MEAQRAAEGGASRRPALLTLRPGMAAVERCSLHGQMTGSFRLQVRFPEGGFPVAVGRPFSNFSRAQSQAFETASTLVRSRLGGTQAGREISQRFSRGFRAEDPAPSAAVFNASGAAAKRRKERGNSPEVCMRELRF